MRDVLGFVKVSLLPFLVPLEKKGGSGGYRRPEEMFV